MRSTRACRCMTWSTTIPPWGIITRRIRSRSTLLTSLLSGHNAHECLFLY
jgi:hypothetical protein